MPVLINGKEQVPVFDPHEDCWSELPFIIRPGESEVDVAIGVTMAELRLADEARKFVWPKCWKYVEFYRVNPEPPKEGRLGWRYRGRK